MGASFRTTGQVLALAGCPRLTISPALLEELDATEGSVAVKIRSGDGSGKPVAPLSESAFLWGHNQDAMANDKLAEGIRRFHEDQLELESLIDKRLG